MAHKDGTAGLAAEPATPLAEKVQFEFLSPALVLMTYRGGSLGPTAWNCNACWPVNHQRLVTWDGQQVRALAERVFAEPCLTATLFLGALQAGDRDLASRHASGPAVVGRVLDVLGSAKGWETPDCWTAGGAGFVVRDLERRNWDLIPAAHRTSVPPERRTFELTLRRAGQRVVLGMVRLPQGWVVTGAGRRVPAP